jgi:hypothetical protein
MALIRFISGEIRGSVGAITGQKWKSIQVVRAKTAPSNPNSPAQKSHREGFRRATALGVPLVPQIYPYFKPKKKQNQTNFNYFMALNKDFINAGGVDYSLLRFTDGNLPGIKSLGVQTAGISPADIKMTADMTSHLTPAPFAVSASSQRSGSPDDTNFAPYLAFDGLSPDPSDYSRCWESRTGQNEWLQVKLDAPRPLKRLELYNRAYSGAAALCPLHWVIQGSNDGQNFTDILSGEFTEGTTVSGYKHDVIIGNETPYLYYRFFCIDSTYPTLIGIGELKYFYSLQKTFHLTLETWDFAGSSPTDLLVIGVVNLENREAIITDLRRADSPIQDLPLNINYKTGDTFLIYAFCTDGKSGVSKSTHMVYTIP